MTDWMDAQFVKITLVMKAKSKLIDADLLSGSARCQCQPKGTRTLKVRLAPSNKHARAFCRECNFSMME